MTINTFINKLWNNKPELVKKELREIFKIKDNESLEYDYTNIDGSLVFEHKLDERRTSYIFVRDYTIHYWGNEEDLESAESMKWMDFMVRIFKEKYIKNFELIRQNQIDSHTNQFNNTTNNIKEKLYGSIYIDNTVNEL